MRLRLAALVIIVFAFAPASACENETGVNRFGEEVHVSVWPSQLQAVFSRQSLGEDRLDWALRVTQAARKKPDFDNLNELAVALMRFRRLPAAIRLLHVLEVRFPGRYETATNLGTFFELAGDNANALHWIREGMRRNPSSHDGSEWVHARILEAKVAGTATKGGSLLGMNFGRAPMVVAPKKLPFGNDGRAVDAKALSWHLFVQLSERTQYVPAPDPVVASLFFDWGNNELASGTLDVADIAYEFAQQYGHPQRPLIAARRREIARIRESLD